MIPALLIIRRVVCWGDNSGGLLSVSNLYSPTQISIGIEHVCAIDSSGLKCCGYGDYSQNIVPSELESIATNGILGSSNSSLFSSAPTDNLCEVGDASIVTGTHPWECSYTCIAGGLVPVDQQLD